MTTYNSYDWTFQTSCDRSPPDHQHDWHFLATWLPRDPFQPNSLWARVMTDEELEHRKRLRSEGIAP